MIARKILIAGDATSTPTTNISSNYDETYSGTAGPGSNYHEINIEHEPIGILHYFCEESRYYNNLLKGLKLSFEPSWSFEEELKKKVRFLYNNPIIKIFRKDRLIGRREKRIGRKR